LRFGSLKEKREGGKDDRHKHREKEKEDERESWFILLSLDFIFSKRSDCSEDRETTEARRVATTTTRETATTHQTRRTACSKKETKTNKNCQGRR
jgi:hypothetical protein